MRGTNPPSLRRFLREFQRLRCYLCGAVMRIKQGRGWLNDPHRWSADHVRPRSKGHQRGRNTLMACQHCNNGKGAREPYACEVFYAEQASIAFELTHRAWRLTHTNRGRREARLQAQGGTAK